MNAVVRVTFPAWLATRSRKGRLVGAAVALAAAVSCSRGGVFGKFIGTVKTEWTDPDRKMTLLADFQYVDPSGKSWMAPKGSIIDGASIPRILWTAVGSPFTGSYRNASVVHDVACDKRDRPWQDVHLMFYNACRCGGVGETEAKLLYAGVYHFGPRWSTNGMRIAYKRTTPEDQDLAQLKTFIETKNPSLQEIQTFQPQR